jgi:VanZ family protein
MKGQSTSPISNTPRRPRTTVRWCAVAAWAALIFAMSSLHGSQVPGRFGDEAHVAEYVVLGALVVFALLASLEVRPAAWIAVAACWIYAVSDEWHQAFVPGRVPDPMDWTRDAVGVGIGVALALLLLAKLARVRARRDALRDAG